MSREKAFRILRSVSALLVGATGVRHAWLAATGDGDVVRHWIFMAINVGFAALLVVKPTFALILAVPLAAQQMWSHGTDFWLSLHGPGPVDLASLAVCLFFPALVTLLYFEATRGRRGADPMSR